ncbi:MAG: Fic family protein [Verrucomicrobiota bacterium]
MNTVSETIDALKTEWDILQPLALENEQRLWKKFRLEWNYHSNHIEGNTLTYGETELLLLHDQTHGNHTLREYEEMKAHDVGIAHLLTLAEDKSRLIGESDIRDLNKLILKEPFWKPAQTAEGKPSRKQIIPGDYKTSPNNVITATGELFEFSPPSEVPARMERLVKWLDASLGSGTLHPVAISAKLHHDFVLIHPFDDGNGRVARMLVNYLFLRLGYPPIIVPTQEKAVYLAALRLADAGDLDSLVSYLGKRLEHSLVMAVKAGKGESVEEAGDLEKEIALFIQTQEHHKEKVKPRSTDALRDLYNLGFKRLFTSITERMKVFNPLFLETQIYVQPGAPGDDSDPVNCFESQLSQGFRESNQFLIRFNLEGYRGEAEQPFNLSIDLMIQFLDFNYTITLRGQQKLRNLYSVPIVAEEIEIIVEDCLRYIFDAIKKETKANS